MCVSRVGFSFSVVIFARGTGLRLVGVGWDGL